MIFLLLQAASCLLSDISQFWKISRIAPPQSLTAKRDTARQNSSLKSLFADPASLLFFSICLFRIMKTDFEARPVFLHDDIRIKAHFLICFLALVIYRYLERDLKNAFSCETILDKLRTMNFADIQEQGFIPLYTRDKLTDALHNICGFETDYKFITKRQMKNIQKKSKGRE